MGWFRSNNEKNKFEDMLADIQEHENERNKLSKKQLRSSRKRDSGMQNTSNAMSTSDFRKIKQSIQH
ncbi:MAG: hypothetical protein ABIR96_09200 [Bdellovibrionota bacterium]